MKELHLPRLLHGPDRFCSESFSTLYCCSTSLARTGIWVSTRWPRPHQPDPPDYRSHSWQRFALSSLNLPVRLALPGSIPQYRHCLPTSLGHCASVITFCLRSVYLPGWPGHTSAKWSLCTRVGHVVYPGTEQHFHSSLHGWAHPGTEAGCVCPVTCSVI